AGYVVVGERRGDLVHDGQRAPFESIMVGALAEERAPQRRLARARWADDGADAPRSIRQWEIHVDVMRARLLLGDVEQRVRAVDAVGVGKVRLDREIKDGH